MGTVDKVRSYNSSRVVRPGRCEKLAMLGVAAVAFGAVLILDGHHLRAARAESAPRTAASNTAGHAGPRGAPIGAEEEERSARRDSPAVPWLAPRQSADSPQDVQQAPRPGPADSATGHTRAYGSYLLQGHAGRGDSAAVTLQGTNSAVDSSAGMSPALLAAAGTTSNAAGTTGSAAGGLAADKISAGLSAHAGGGVEVEEVLPGSIAGKLGLEPGDVILAVNSTFVDTPADLARLYRTEGFPRQLDALRGGAPFHRHP